MVLTSHRSQAMEDGAEAGSAAGARAVGSSQMSTARAALLMSADLVATVRAMFLVHSRLAAELMVAERVGLRAALGRRGPDGAPILPEMTFRIAALIAFYLSDEYTALSQALSPTE